MNRVTIEKVCGKFSGGKLTSAS
ncbi:hypothetical protein FAGKG844_190076 [Frankia sp. AgKG'84/4]